jgi:hypothetical protein
LWFVETPLDRLGQVRRHLGADDVGSIEMLFEVERHVSGEGLGVAASQTKQAKEQKTE